MEVKKVYEGKIITLGDSLVGKTCIIYRFVDQTFIDTYLSTIGLDIKTKIVKLDNNRKIKLSIHDTAGQERFKSLSVNYIKKADGILIVYDITNKLSFKNVENWIKTAKEEINKKNIPIYLIGNKSDLEDEREITTKHGENLAERYKIKFYETSCKTGKNIEKCFQDIANEMYNIIEEKMNKNKKEGKDNKSDLESFQIEIKEGKKKKCC